ncbi:MAG: hypothetical protein ABJB86_17035 [Bacteroidota bacterium]
MEKLIRNRSTVDSLVKLKNGLPVNFTWENTIRLKKCFATYCDVMAPVITDLTVAGMYVQ